MNRIQPHVRKIIFYNQVEIIPVSQDWVNIKKFINVINSINRSKKKSYMIAFLDAAKLL